MSHADPQSPATDDMLRCEKCGFEVQVIHECECKTSCVKLRCCGQDLKNVTLLKVPSSAGN